MVNIHDARIHLAPDARVIQPTKSLWRATASIPTHDPLAADIDVDVAIIGAGITGLTAALLLRERGRSVAIIERDVIGSGESGNTTAHITAAVDARYHYLRRHYGEEEARLVADASRAAIAQIAELIDANEIDCHLEWLPGYLYTEKRSRVAELKNEHAAAREAGLDASWTEDVPLPFVTRGAVRFENQAQFHPGEYLAGLARAAVASGCRIYERTIVRAIDDGEPCRVETSGGTVRAASVLMATNTPIAGFTDLHTKSAAYRTYTIAYHVEGNHPHGLFWDTADPYHYTRWQKTDRGTYMIVGGEDHRVGEQEDTDACFDRLNAYVHETFGVHPEKFRWSGQIIEPHGGLPFIGGSGNIYISTGYAGQGMTFGTFGGMLVTDLISGVENRWAELFKPSRLRPDVLTREFLTENAHFPAHLVEDRLTSRGVEGRSERDVHAGEAKILEIDGKRVAAWRDESGQLHMVSAVCTHLKCDVAWNVAEKSWDCPCHGSRFTPDGEVLNGPARDPLEKL